jgi:hypothetical protein
MPSSALNDAGRPSSQRPTRPLGRLRAEGPHDVHGLIDLLNALRHLQLLAARGKDAGVFRQVDRTWLPSAQLPRDLSGLGCDAEDSSDDREHPLVNAGDPLADHAEQHLFALMGLPKGAAIDKARCGRGARESNPNRLPGHVIGERRGHSSDREEESQHEDAESHGEQA